MMKSKEHFNKKRYTKEYKIREIQRNLTKKARLKKKYLKLLKEEGYDVPEEKKHTEGPGLTPRELKEQRLEEGKRRVDERKEMKKQRKRMQRERAEERRTREMERIRISREKHLERERRSQRLTQKTRTGQPLMGPRIEDLLSKIKSDDTYTN